MRIFIQISASSYLGLEKPTSEYNHWSYRTSDAILTESQFSIDLSDFPIFWREFLEHYPSLRKSLRDSFVGALRGIPRENVGPSFGKALEVLTEN